jgi:hypothetical protein
MSPWSVVDFVRPLLDASHLSNDPANQAMASRFEANFLKRKEKDGQETGIHDLSGESTKAGVNGDRRNQLTGVYELTDTRSANTR